MALCALRRCVVLLLAEPGVTRVKSALLNYNPASEASSPASAPEPAKVSTYLTVINYHSAVVSGCNLCTYNGV